MRYLYDACDQISDFCHQQLLRKMRRKISWTDGRMEYQISVINSCWEKCAYMFNVYKNQLSRQTGSRNLTGPKTLPTIWYTYMMLVTKYQISAINSYWEKCDEKYLGRMEYQISVIIICWEKCDAKCAYIFNVYKNQLSRQTGSRNLTGPKTLPTIWYTYMMLVTKYQKFCHQQLLRKMRRKISWTDGISDLCHHYLLRKMWRKMCIYLQCV